MRLTGDEHSTTGLAELGGSAGDQDDVIVSDAGSLIRSQAWSPAGRGGGPPGQRLVRHA